MVKIKDISNIIVAIGALLFGVWLSIWVMLVGGIMQSVEGFTNGVISMAVWGIVRAVFFECGFLPTYIIWMIQILVSD